MIRWIFPFVIIGLLSGCASNSILVSVGDHSPQNSQKTNSLPLPQQSKEELSTLPKEDVKPKEHVKPKEIVAARDIWDRLRTGFEIPDPELNVIENHIRLLQANPEAVNRLLERSSSYLFYIIEEVEARDLPSELALLPFVESAFNPKAVSSAKAAGMWQFMPATGKSFNLKQNMFLDERGDIIKSTRAALDYLQRLHYQFDDWQLALAAYNWGEGSVSRAIKKNQNANQTKDYFSLSMPKETKNYVPKLLAYKRIIENPEKYGFRLPNVPNYPYFVEVPVHQDIDVDKAIELSDMAKEQFVALNPSFTKPVILKEFNQAILLPYGKAEIFKDNLRTHQKPLSSWTAVKVNKTETVEKIAQQIQVTPADIRLVNNIPTGMKIRSGSSLLIPKKTEHTGDINADIAQNGSLLLERELTAVPIRMNCRGKKCTATPSQIPSYLPNAKTGLPKTNSSDSPKINAGNAKKVEKNRDQTAKKSNNSKQQSKNHSTKKELDSKK